MSSYKENDFGDVFRAIINGFRPNKGVELGVLDGYSTFHIAKAMKSVGGGHLDAYDLWEDYRFNHGRFADVEQLINVNNLEDFVSLKKGDAYKVYEEYEDNSLSFLHVDISNTGETVRKIMELWDPKMVQGAVVLFEGGTKDRDEVEWMVKYDMPKIKPEIESNKIINDKYVYGTYLRFPGLTIMLKKRY